MDEYESLSVKSSDTRKISPPTARHKCRVEDGLERLFREEKKSRTAKFHHTTEAGICEIGDELLRRKACYVKFTLSEGQYPFFVVSDGPMQGFTGLVRKPTGIVRKVLMSPDQVPEHAYKYFEEQTEKIGGYPLPIITYATEDDGKCETRLLLKDQRIKTLEDELNAQKKVYSGMLRQRVEQSAKSFAYQAFMDKSKRLIMDLSDPALALTIIAEYISNIGVPIKLVVTNEGKSDESAEIIFFEGKTLQAKYANGGETIYGDAAYAKFLLLPHELKDQGRMELSSMEMNNLHLAPGKGLTRRLSVRKLGLESVLKLDESSDEWPVYSPKK